MRRAVRIAGLAATLLLGSLAAAGTAQAAPGDLTFDTCAADTSVGGLCTDIPEGPLDNPRAVVMSPDGRSIYVAGFDADAISHFTVGADGRATFTDCVSNSGANGCVNLPGGPIEAVQGLGISPDGNSVYASSRTSRIVTQFARGATGTLTFVACVTDNSVPGCTDIPGTSLSTPKGIAVSPDGDSVYVVSSTPGAIAHFGRNVSGGLTYAGCFSNDGSGGTCADVPGAGAPLDQEPKVVVSPNGASVYVTATPSGDVSHFAAVPTGQLSWVGCVGSTSAQGCTDLPGSPITGAKDLALSADGGSLYVGAGTSNSVARFSTNASGQLSLAACVSSDGGTGCDDPQGQPLHSVAGLGLSPDGGDVYAAAFLSSAVTRLAAGPGGGLDFASCVSPQESAGSCSKPPAGLISGLEDTVVSPDGRSVYAIDFGSDALIRFAREADQPPDTAPPDLSVTARKGKAGKPVKVLVACSEACSVNASGTAKPKRSKRGQLAPATAQLAAGQEALLVLKPTGKLKRKLRRAGKGRASIAITATDAAGNAASSSVPVKLK